jgi:hypothetical protein
MLPGSLLPDTLNKVLSWFPCPLPAACVPTDASLLHTQKKQAMATLGNHWRMLCKTETHGQGQEDMCNCLRLQLSGHESRGMQLGQPQSMLLQNSAATELPPVKTAGASRPCHHGL